MNLKEKIMKQFYFAKNRWLMADRSLGRGVIATLYLTVAVPGVIIRHCAEKLVIGMQFAYTSIGDALKKSFPAFSKKTEKQTKTTPDTQETNVSVEHKHKSQDSHNKNLQTTTKVASNQEQPETQEKQTNMETRIIVHPDDLSHKIFKHLENLQNQTNRRLIYMLAKEHEFHCKKISNKYSLVKFSEDKAENFITINSKMLIESGYKLLDKLHKEKSLNQDDYMGFCNTFKLQEFIDDEANRLAPEKLDHLAAILCIAWALHDINIKNGYDVARGSTTILNNTAIYNFFLRYGTLITGDNNPGFFTNNSSCVYGRSPSYKLSSHYKNDTQQYGIDIRFQEKGEAFGILPHGHSHILFGLIQSKHDTKSTFFKFEPHGMGTVHDLLQHGLDFANSGTVSGITYREKDIPKDFIAAYNLFCQQTGETAYAKLIKDMWQHINNYISNNKQTVDLEKIEDDLSDWDVINKPELNGWCMHSNPSTIALNAKNDFIKLANKHKMDPETLSSRFGNEVIVDLSAIRAMPQGQRHTLS